MKNIIIIAVVVLVMAGAAYFVAAKFLAPPSAPSEAAAEPEQADSGGHGEVAAGPEIYKIEQLLVNPKGTSGTRYLSTSLGIEVPNAAMRAKLEAQDLKLRDMLISILSSRTVPQLNDPKEREEMRGEIQKRISGMLDNQPLSAVYFIDYVMQ
ncbi:MAG: flagellar basal body-associated FliL family protein [Candidatus Zixiibacteriota bacterium]